MSKTVIELKEASIQHGYKEILKNVNLEIKEGEFVYLVGKIGSGKSSLIKTLNAELPLQKGSGMIADFKLKNIKRHYVASLRKRLGIVFQDYQLLHDRPVYQNLLFVLQATDWKNQRKMDQRIEEVLMMVGMVDHKNKMPHELSGGEQQRIVIARALLNDPEIILADEPTGNLDPETSDALAQLLHDISRNGKTVLMTTHQVDLLEKFPARTLKCEAGELTKI